MKKFLAMLLAMAILMPAAAQQNRADNPMTRAVLRAYDQILAADPTDGETLLHRANEYYNINNYDKALGDVEAALRYLPAKDNDNRVQAYLLRANIYLLTERPQMAISDFDMVLAIDPNSYSALYQKANAEYQTGNYAAAKIDYQRMQRIQPRSAESLVGLARIAVKENNLGTANELLNQAVAFDPHNSNSYVNRASVRRSMGNESGAVEDLILAIATDDTNGQALNMLADMGDTHYGTVMSGLTNAMQQAPGQPSYAYLRAVIAQSHYNYAAALDDYRRILDKQLYISHGLYASMAECQYAMTHFQDALDNIDHAISMNPNVTAHYVLRSQILRALGRFDEARAAALKATVVNPGTITSLTQLGLCNYSLGQYSSANDLWGEAMMTEPNDPMLGMLRAWVLEQNLNQPVAAKGFYEQVATNDVYPADNVRSLRGFAMLFAGDREGALAWIKNILATTTDHDGLINYLAACLYAQAGDDDNALDCVQRAVELGYSNLYDWNYNNDARINVAPVRDNLRFLNLMTRLEK